MPIELLNLYLKLMSSQCKSSAQSCYFNCCDMYRECPNSASDCEYYYTKTFSVGSIVGIVIGSLCLLIILIVLLYCICKPKQRPQYAMRTPPNYPMTAQMGQPTMQHINNQWASAAIATQNIQNNSPYAFPRPYTGSQPYIVPEPY